jgi:hypothetical protein
MADRPDPRRRDELDELDEHGRWPGAPGEEVWHG